MASTKLEERERESDREIKKEKKKEKNDVGQRTQSIRLLSS